MKSNLENHENRNTEINAATSTGQGEMPINPRVPPAPRPPADPPKKKSNWFQRVDFVDELIGFHGGSQKRAGVKLALWTWLSVAVDTLILISMSCFLMMAFSYVMKTSFHQISILIKQDSSVLQLFLISFLFCFWTYLIFMRVFNGATLGEWTCSLRLGQPLQRIRSNYIFKVLLRTSLIMLTGIVTLPLLSLIFRRDLAGEISGVKIYSLE